MRNIKYIIITLVMIVISCTTDDDAISTKDLLLGKWKFTSYSLNGVTPNNFSNCQSLSTLKITENELIFNDFGDSSGNDIDCTTESVLAQSYYLNKDVIILGNETLIILELTPSHLKLEKKNNNNTIITFYNNIN